LENGLANDGTVRFLLQRDTGPGVSHPDPVGEMAFSNNLAPQEAILYRPGPEANQAQSFMGSRSKNVPPPSQSGSSTSLDLKAKWSLGRSILIGQISWQAPHWVQANGSSRASRGGMS
jgi:hypothetical protein